MASLTHSDGGGVVLRWHVSDFLHPLFLFKNTNFRKQLSSVIR